MSRYLITAHHGLDGVALSRPGHWGGKRYPDASAAYDAAVIDARGGPIAISTETVRRKRGQG